MTPPLRFTSLNQQLVGIGDSVRIGARSVTIALECQDAVSRFHIKLPMGQMSKGSCNVH